ncbi:MAG: hypothetical protein GY697_21510, partial [Desulfobacterales bacterium]|nr:hypothetical protein [Desulfobacterales bacterium]
MTGYRVIVATIRYGKGRFEEAFSRPERVVQIILKVLESVSTHRIGQLIQVYFNRYFGGTALAYKGQESLSSNRTSQKYLLLNESAEERIQSLLEMVRSGIGFIMEDDETRERARQIASFSTTVAAL